jgi:ureidoglycolate hydrolase
VTKDWAGVSDKEVIDLAAASSGGKVVSVSDNYFSSQDNVLMPGRGINMGDGWETRRSRRKNNSEWIVIKLARTGVVKNIEIDTAHFKGNYPNTITLLGCHNEGSEWKELLSQHPLKPHLQHYFEKEIKDVGPITHVRAIIYPDGGVSRIRLNGHIISQAVDQHEKKTVLHPQALEQSNFQFYGTVLEYPEDQGLKEHAIPLGLSVSSTSDSSPPSLSILRVPTSKQPYHMTTLHKQLSSSVTLFPRSQSKYLVLSALSSKIGSTPDLLNFYAAVASPNQAVHINYGTWYQIVPLEGTHADFYVVTCDAPTSQLKKNVAKYGIYVA